MNGMAILQVLEMTQHFYRKAVANKIFAGNSTDVLTFKCGGSQHVNEICGKTYTIDVGGFKFSSHSELECALNMLSEVESRGIPAPGGLQRSDFYENS